MPDFIYPAFGVALARGEIDLEGDALKVMLAGGRYRPDASHRSLADVEEVSGPGYAAGGLELTGKRLVVGPDGTVSLHAGEVEWTELEIPVRWAIVYHAPTGTLIRCVDLGASPPSKGMVLSWDAAGVLAQIPNP